MDRLLTSLHGAFTVIAVDDASRRPDQIAAVAARHHTQLLRLPDNLGPAGARNTGLAHVVTPYVLVVDPGLAALAPRILGDGDRPGRLARYEATHGSLDLGPDGGLVHPHSPIGWLPSACLLARTSALGTGFDDHMRVGEDVDLIWRLTEGGWRVRYEPAVTAQHADHRPLGPWLARKAVYGSGAAALAIRHGNKVAPATFTPLAAATAVAALAQRRCSVPVVLAITTLTTARLARTLLRSDHPRRLATELTARGLVSNANQMSALLLRHWWPLTAAAAMVSRRVRRAALLATVAHSLTEYTHRDVALDPVTFTLLRRLDDLAYGTGLWTGVVRARSVRALQPRLFGS